MMHHHDPQSTSGKGNTRGPNIHQQYHTSSPNSGMHHQMSHVMGQSEHHQQAMEANMISRPDDNLRHPAKSQMNPFLANGTQQMPTQKQRFLDAMMISSVSGDPNRPGPPGAHPEQDGDARHQRGGFDPSFPQGSNAIPQDGGDDLSYRNALRAIQLRGGHQMPQHSEVHGPNPSSLGVADKDNIKSSPYYQGMPPSQDRPHSGNMQQTSVHGSQNYDGPFEAAERRVSANVQAPSMRNIPPRDNNASSASPHPMMAGGPYGSSQHLHDQEAYNYYMVNKPGGPPNFYNQYPTVSPDESQDHLPFANSNGKIPYYPEDQQPHPYSAYMLGNTRHQDKRARHAYDTMAPDYANFAGHQPMHHPGFGRAEQEMMHQQQGGFMLPSFDPRNHPYSGMMHPHMGMSAPAPAPSKPVKAKKRYSGDMPRRPLTAYNFFFSEEREIILAQLPDEEGTPDEKENVKSEKEGESTEVNPVDKILSKMRTLDDEEMGDLKSKIRTNTERMLKIHKESDRVKKSHKKVHGKIAFQHLAKIVGQRWRNLPADEKKYYEDLASKDSNRFNEQLEAYNKKEQETANKKDASE
mmetsp:Transcript_11106/g.16833  ORF Transcript_11106/g.16833 Transcript_11106/m.16833 type:complete len:579 (+) Transcript_11106:150-1886(+)